MVSADQWPMLLIGGAQLPFLAAIVFRLGKMAAGLENFERRLTTLEQKQ